MARPIRVLQLRDSPWVDGPGRTILETTSHIDPARVEFHVGALVAEGQGKHPLVEALRARNAHVHVIRDRPGVDRALIDDVIALMEKLSIDVLHCCEPRANLLALMIRRRRRVVLASTSHGWIANDWRGRVYRVLDKTMLRFFDGVILVSHAMRKLVPRWWLPDARVSVIHNALVLESYGRDIVDAPRRIVGATGDIVLLNVGRLSPEKGQDLLLRAFAAVAAEEPRLKLRFAGIGPLEPALRAQVTALGLAGRVEFLSYVDDMPRLYAETDLVVQSSLTEGLPNVILEAAYLRVPIVATRVGGTGEIVEHERSGWLLEPGSSGALERAFRAFLADPARFASMAALGHDTVRTEYSFATRTERLTSFYERLAGAMPR